MRKIDFTKNMVTDYYSNQYREDISKYFRIESRENINLILRLDKRNGYSNGTPSGYVLFGKGSTEKNYIFTGIFTYMILTQQTLYELFGNEIQNDYHKCTGWPLISAGLAGPNYSFENMLKEAEIHPEKSEIDNFINMLKVVCPIMNQEMKDFILEHNSQNLDENAYQRFASTISEHTELFFSTINNKIETFIEKLMFDKD